MLARWKARSIAWFTLNWSYIRLAIKGSVPPGILVCLIASDAWLNHFQANSVFAPVIAACALPILPKARLVSLHVRLAFSFAFTYAYCLLAGWCGLRARQNTKAPDVGAHYYNGSAETVVAIYFVFFFWACFTLKSAYSTWQLPCVLSGLYAAAVLPSVAKADHMHEVLKTANIPIEAFFAGLAFAFVGGIVVFPASCRDAFFTDLQKCLKEMVSTWKIYSELMTSFATDEEPSQEAVLISRLKSRLQAFLANANTLKADLAWARREIAWSRVGRDDLQILHSCIANFVPALSGVVSTADILQRTRQRDVVQSTTTSLTCEGKEQSDKVPPRDGLQWREAQREMHQNSRVVSRSIINAFEKVSTQLEKAVHGKFNSQNSVALDEKVPNVEQHHLSTQHDFKKQEGHVLNRNSEGPCAKSTQLSMVERFIACKSWLQELSSHQQHAQAIHYFMVLNEQQMLQTMTFEVTKLAQTAETLCQKPKTPVIPSFHIRTLRTIRRVTINEITSAAHQIFCSKHAGFGLRGACAMMSVGIVAFLSSSTTFFSEQRFLWALYAILLSLNETAGSSTLSLCLRFAGTLSSMIASYLIWYVPNQHTAGILVLLWVWFIVLGYLYAKFPRIQGAWFVALIAAVVMVANELQVRRLGVAVVQAAGQAVYKPYVLFPYRLAIVALGIVVAYLWTLFPVPLTEHRELCHNLSLATSSLSKLHLALQEGTQVQLLRHESKDSNLRDREEKLSESRRQHLSDFTRYSNAAASFIKFLDWEWTLKTRWPKHTASKIIELLEQVANHMSLINSISGSFKSSDDSKSVLTTNRKMVIQHLCPKGLTSRMIEISNALETGQPLAPDLQDLNMPDLTDFLALDCLADNQVATAVLIHTTNWYMIQNLKELTGFVASFESLLRFEKLTAASLVAEVVGTVDFMV